MIYFISAKEANKIKIGFTNNIKKRFSQLQVASPNELQLLLLIEGDEKLEKELHKKFKECRTGGEWFEHTNEISNFISESKTIDKSYQYSYQKRNTNFNEETESQMRNIRRQKNMTYKEVAELLNIKPPSVQEMENNEIKKTISLNGLIKFGKAMGYKFEYRFVPI